MFLLFPAKILPNTLPNPPKQQTQQHYEYKCGRQFVQIFWLFFFNLRLLIGTLLILTCFRLSSGQTCFLGIWGRPWQWSFLLTGGSRDWCECWSPSARLLRHLAGFPHLHSPWLPSPWHLAGTSHWLLSLKWAGPLNKHTTLFHARYFHVLLWQMSGFKIWIGCLCQRRHTKDTRDKFR